MDKPELPLELLNVSIAHIEGLKAKTTLLLGKKNLLSDAIISMDLCGHSYDYSELLVMRDGLLNTACNVTNTTVNAFNSPEDAIQSIHLAREKMDELEAKKRQALLNFAVCSHNLMNEKANRPEQDRVKVDISLTRKVELVTMSKDQLTKTLLNLI